MRRIAILVAALVAVLAPVVALVLPPIFGGIARSSLGNLEAGIGIGQVAGYDVELDVAFYDWDAGWFTSTASASLNAGLAGVRFFSAEAPVVVTLRHGPMLSGIPSGLGWASVELVLDESTVPALRELYEKPGVGPVAHFGLLLGLGGSATVGVEVPDFRVSRGDEFLEFGGFEAVAGVASDRIDFDAELDGLHVGSLADRYEVGQSALVARLYKDAHMPVLWLGDLLVDSAGLTMLQDHEGMEAGRFRVRVGTGVARDMFDARMQGEMSDVRVSRGDDGQYHLNDLTLDVGLQFGAGALVRLMRGVGFGMDLESALGALATADDLIRERLSLSVRRLAFSHEGRPASATLSVEYRGDDLPGYPDVGGLEGLIQNPARLPINANFDLAFHQDLPGGFLHSMGAPRREAAEFERVVLEMARSGVLEERGSNYGARVELADGLVRLNGEPLDRAIRGLGGSEAGEFLRLLVDELL